MGKCSLFVVCESSPRKVSIIVKYFVSGCLSICIFIVDEGLCVGKGAWGKSVTSWAIGSMGVALLTKPPHTFPQLCHVKSGRGRGSQYPLSLPHKTWACPPYNHMLVYGDCISKQYTCTDDKG